jgi:hypothetical protein
MPLSDALAATSSTTVKSFTYKNEIVAFWVHV